MESSDPYKRFWNNRIEKWDAIRHENKVAPLNLLHLATRNSQDSVDYRDQIVRDHFGPFVKGKKIAELGCGTGRMAQDMIDRGAAFYSGYDFTDNGIAMAKQRTAGQPNVKFEAVDILDLEPLDADFVFSLGLFSWSSIQLIDHIFRISKGGDFLHNFSVRRYTSIKQILKFVHTNLFSINKFQPVSRPLEQVTSIPFKYGWDKVYILRHRKLQDAVCISSKPFPEFLGKSYVIHK